MPATKLNGDRSQHPATNAHNDDLTSFDLIVTLLLLLQGTLAFRLANTSSNYFAGDTTSFELAQSWLRTGTYGYNGNLESLFPPGHAAILALLSATFGSDRSIMIHATVVFATLGLLTSYALLRSMDSRGIAAACCLLVTFSTTIFALETRYAASDLPYFATSIATLYLGIRLDRASALNSRILLAFLCGSLFLGSLLIRSAGVALIVGLLAWLVVTSLADWKTAHKRWAVFLPILLVGIVVQGWWMSWSKRRESLEWELPGFPMSYVAQLEVKDGHHPELGWASLSDIPARVEHNLVQRTAALATILTHYFIGARWFSLLVCGPVILILTGLATSLWRRGGEWTDWYFLCYELMYLLWPWDLEMRFLLPSVPLACLYLWRGGVAICQWAYQKPRLVASVSLPLLLVLTAAPALSQWRALGIQFKLSALACCTASIGAAWMLWKGSIPFSATLSRSLQISRTQFSFRSNVVMLRQLVGAAVVGALCLIGIVQQVHAGRENLAFDITRTAYYPDIEAAEWVKAHTAAEAIVMARQVDVVYHYCRRKIVWFPPLSESDVLMAGIRKHHVEFVMVIDRKQSYWLPPEEDCMRDLLSAYPNVFQLVHEGTGERVFAVAKNEPRNERQTNAAHD